MNRIVVFAIALATVVICCVIIIFCQPMRASSNRAIELGTGMVPGAHCSDWGAHKGSDDVDNAYCEHDGVTFWCHVASLSAKPDCELIRDRRAAQTQPPPPAPAAAPAGGSAVKISPAGTGSGSAKVPEKTVDKTADKPGGHP